MTSQIFNALDEASKTLIKTTDLMVIRDPYVILGLVVMAVFVLFLVSKMPNTKDEASNENVKETFKRLFKNKTYSKGVLAQILYVGAQIMCWTYIYQYAEGMGYGERNSWILSNGCFYFFYFWSCCGNRITTIYKLRSPFDGCFQFFATLSTLCVVFIGNMIGLYCLVGVSFFMSLMFPTIYGISLGGLTADESKIGSAGLVMAIVGGALMPKLQGMLIDLGGYGCQRY